MRVVLDTNVIVSGMLAPRGAPARILGHWRAGLLTVLVTADILDEYRETLQEPSLARRHKRTKGEIDELMAGFELFAEMVVPSESVVAVPDDPDDDVFVSCGVAGDGRYIVSGDRHLLALREYRGIRILSPAAFLALLEAGGEGAPP